MTLNPLCAQAPDFFYRELTAEEMATFAAHLPACPVCPRALDELKQLSLLVRSSAPKIRPDAASATRALLSANIPLHRTWRQRILSAPAMALFSLALTGAAVVVFWQRDMTTPTVIPPIRWREAEAPAAQPVSPTITAEHEGRRQDTVDKAAPSHREGIKKNALSARARGGLAFEQSEAATGKLRTESSPAKPAPVSEPVRSTDSISDNQFKLPRTRSGYGLRPEAPPAPAAQRSAEADEAKTVAGTTAAPPAPPARAQELDLAPEQTPAASVKKEKKSVDCSAEISRALLESLKKAASKESSCERSFHFYQSFIAAHPDLAECTKQLPCYSSWREKSGSK